MQRPLFGREHNYIFGFVCLCVCIFLSFRLLQIPGAVAGSLPTAERLRRSSERTRTEDGTGDCDGTDYSAELVKVVRAERRQLSHVCFVFYYLVLLLPRPLPHCLTIVQGTRESERAGTTM